MQGNEENYFDQNFQKKVEIRTTNIELQRHQPLFIGAIIEEMATFLFIQINYEYSIKIKCLS